MPPPGILLVDDDPAVRSSITFALEIEGWAVAAFASAEALIESASGLRPACIVIDQRLPDLDGLSLLARLRADGNQVPAIIITSNPTQRLRERVHQAGARMIEKPLLSDALVAAVREIIAAQGQV